MKIHDQLDKHWTFGLWAECPPDVAVAWGARAIADNGCGFSLLPDRQTWAGSKELRGVFSNLLNHGPLKRAIEEAKRLRDGWKPYEALSEKAFEEYWRKRLKEEPALFESFEASSGRWTSEPPGYPHYDAPKDANPRAIWQECRDETERVKAYDDEADRLEQEGKEMPIPDPPPKCENAWEDDDGEEEECGAVFKKVRGKWEGCSWFADSWECESCGNQHYAEEDEDDPYSPPKTPVISAYSKIVGYQGQRMLKDESELFTLYDDHFVTIKANTNSSHGYVYIIAYPKHTVIDMDKVKNSDKHPGFENGNGPTLAAPDDVFWKGPFPIPQPGDKVTITRPELGQAMVIAHLVEHNYLHLITVPEGDLPDWWHEQNKDRVFPPARTWNVMGSEIGAKVIRAPKEEEKETA